MRANFSRNASTTEMREAIIELVYTVQDLKERLSKLEGKKNEA